MNHKLDTNKKVYFYEQEFYVLSNFSAFRLVWEGYDFDTSEAAYQWCKFTRAPDIQQCIRTARSAHQAYRIAIANKHLIREDWNGLKALSTMKLILIAKLNQHEYVARKLLETGNRELIEDSWRDSYWGIGKDKKGLNMLGKLWMEVRFSLVKPLD